jgi:N-glycosylase/DNA lyase
MIALNDISTRPLRDGALPVVEVMGSDLPDPDKTFDCGQCFRFEKSNKGRHESEWEGVAFGRQVSFARDGERLYVYNSTEEEFERIWRRYLDLDTDYLAIDKDILSRSDSDALRNAVSFGHGIRILRQDPWETVCSFIISQNNNIPRIKKIVRALCERAGDRVDGSEEFSFPSPSAVGELGVEGLFGLKTGFRAKYIYDAASRVASGEISLDGIMDMASPEGAEELCRIKGVGPKVAACALLFGFGKYDAFPVDVWIKKAIEKYFPGEFDPSRLGPYAGVAQQYLFYYERYLGGE